ncbi:MAG: energy transducer TonB [Endomicrobia bacterium]|nr:energy transducer TonB [Endomicrobiia bacterium]
MLRKNDFLIYFIISVLMHTVLLMLFVMVNNRAKQLFISAPIDVTFYTPAHRLADPPPPVKVEEKTPPAPEVKETVKEEPKTKEDVIVKAKEKPKPKPQPKPAAKPAPKPAPQQEAKKTEAPPSTAENVSTVQAPQEIMYNAAGAQFEGVAFDTANFKYAYYTNTIVRSIGRRWQWSESYGRLRAVVYFKILRDGSIEGLRIKDSSGDDGFDQNALRAVQRASPFAPLPEGYSGDTLGVYFEFKYRN